MTTYNGVLGIDEQALNEFISSVHEAARNTAFHGSVPVGHLGLGTLQSVEYDITSTPSVLFAPARSETSMAASLELVVEKFTLVLHYTEGRTPTTLMGTLRAGGNVVADPEGFLVPELGPVHVEIPGEAKLTEILNEVVVPYAARFLHEQLLAPIRVPPLGYEDVKLACPRIVSSDERLLATTAVLPAMPGPAPLVGPWPVGRIFVAADFDLVNALGASAVSDMKPVTGHWSKTISFVIGQSTVKADYTATLTALSLRPVKGQPTQVEGTATLNTGAKCWAKNLANVQGSGTTQATVTGQVVFSETSGLAIQLTGLKPFSVKFDLPGSWFDKYASNLANVASAYLRDAISAQLRAVPPLRIGPLPSFPMRVATTNLIIGVKTLEIRTLDIEDRTLLVASAVPDVRSG